jgi:predicted MFS family arabinose efflux permease
VSARVVGIGLQAIHGDRGTREIVPAELFTALGQRDARLHPSAVFWGVAYAYLVTMLGTTLPAPLYGLYQQRLGFSAGVLAVIFALYAAGFLIALLLFGALSDRVGRRPVIAAALVLAARKPYLESFGAAR